MHRLASCAGRCRHAPTAIVPVAISGCTRPILSLPEGHPAIEIATELSDAGVVLGRSKLSECKDSIFEGYAAFGITDASQANRLGDLAAAIATPDAVHPRMLGYVLPGGSQGHDDDGEKGAGRRITEAAKAMSDARSRQGKPPGVAICVTRYFGGTLLGNRRWIMIRASADDALARATAEEARLKSSS